MRKLINVSVHVLLNQGFSGEQVTETPFLNKLTYFFFKGHEAEKKRIKADEL